ncbi:MAG TPA: hypothetical protein VFB00_02925 [Terriglobales bacterium]|nr:hypothetical protein [Terriglobales bacterium]
MRAAFVIVLVVLVPLSTALQTQTQPRTEAQQTARQALLEMFFSEKANHLEKHLPDATRRSFKKFDAGDGRGILAQFGEIAAKVKALGPGFQTFDTGPVLLSAEDPREPGDKVEVTVETDDLVGDEDQIELSVHRSRNGKEESWPVVPRFTFTMKQDADIWRLNEISVKLRVPLADPEFLKTVEGLQREQNEQMIIWIVRSVNTAETSYKAAHNSFACSFSALAKSGAPDSGQNPYLYDPQLASGKKHGYVFAISGCDSAHYKIAAEPAVSDSGQRAFCSDEGGTIRAAGDGKATTCLRGGEPVQEGNQASGIGVVFPGD